MKLAHERKKPRRDWGGRGIRRGGNRSSYFIVKGIPEEHKVINLLLIFPCVLVLVYHYTF
jgi:hypothetical protein